MTAATAAHTARHEGVDAPRTIDPRAVKSRAALIHAMITHLDITLAAPTVSEVVSRAGSSRPTFYQHFGDIPTLMHEAAMDRLEAVLEELSAGTNAEAATWETFAERIFTQLFEHLAEHRAFYLAILHGPSGVAFLNRLIAYLTLRMHTVSPLRHSIRNLVGDEQAPRLSQFLVAGLVSLAIDDLTAEVPVSRMVHTTTSYLSVATSAANISVTSPLCEGENA